MYSIKGFVHYRLEARVPATQSVVWTFTGDDALYSTPIAGGGFVYEGSKNGMLYALDEKTGTVAWSVNLGAPVAPNDELLGGPIQGLAIAEDKLFVPVEGFGLYVFGNQ